MTCQSITGSDIFGQVHWSRSTDFGQSWTAPVPIAAFDRIDRGNNIEEGVCDVVPEYHAPTDTVPAIGHNVWYEHNKLISPQPARVVAYTVLNDDGTDTGRNILDWPDRPLPYIYSCGCAQRVTLDNGDILIPLCVGMSQEQPRTATTALCTYDGSDLHINSIGNHLELNVGRGLLEPSVTRHNGRYYMTLRAEDGRGYVTTSDDGLHWQPIRPWCWENGQPLDMSTTQQRWLNHSDALYLVYTRKTESNPNVFRWRAPLLTARVCTDTLSLQKNSEHTVFPLIGDGVNDPDHVARMGNFHTTVADKNESWVTVGECMPHDNWVGNTMLARITWQTPNRLALSSCR